MNKGPIGFLHPGAMGISLAASAKKTGYETCWVSQGRSPETRARAEEHGLAELPTIEAMCATCSIIVSVCPPHAAADVARQVLDCDYHGIYADVNAISPQSTRAIARPMTAADIAFVDGGIIGGPAWTPGRTWLYLSGLASDQVAACFANGPLETEVIGGEIGKASALKMCFAAQSKGTTALLSAVVAAADALGVRGQLENQWSRYEPDFPDRTLKSIREVTAKAWRFSGEMDEIAATFEAGGLPGGFHLAAAEIYRRMSGFKGASPLPGVDDVLKALQNRDPSSSPTNP